MAPIGWILVGIAVLVVILGLGLRINEKKSTAQLTLRLAEAYRLEGEFETALALYEAVPALDQNLPAAQMGRRRARKQIHEPVMEAGLVEAARRRLVEERSEVQAHLEAEGIDIELPAIE